MLDYFKRFLFDKLERHLVGPIMTRQAECDQHQLARLAEMLRAVFERIDGLGGASEHANRKGASHAMAWQSRLGESLYLGNDEILTRTALGFYLVVPGYNIDVAVGLVRDGIIEPWTTNVVRHILAPGDIYINVGANFGYYTIMGASLVGRSGSVYSVEANPHVFRYLVKSIYWGGYPDVVKAFNLAAYSTDNDELLLQFDPQFIGGGSVMSGFSFDNSLGESLWSGGNIGQTLDDHLKFAHRGVFSTARVKSKKLDTVVGEGVSPKLLHMDIEGAEADALLGAAQMIAQAADMDIIIEWLGTRLDDEIFGPKYQQVVRFLSGLGYKFYRIETNGFGGLGEKPKLKAFSAEQLVNTGHCDVLITRCLRFEADLV